MPWSAIAAPLLGMGASALSSLFGSKGKQKSEFETSEDFTRSMLEDLLKQAFQSEEATRLPVEDPLFSLFRQQLLPLVMSEIQRGQAPVYGPAAQAGFMDELNKLASTSARSLQSNLARVGALDSGRLASGLTEIERSRAGEATRFFRDLPFMESQARLSRLTPLLGLGTGWAGAAPLGQTLWGTNQSSEQVTGSSRETGASTKRGTATHMPANFWSNFAPAFGQGAAKLIDLLSPKWGGKK